MTRIYMVRHCEAIGNVKRLFQGSSDFDISEIGAKQLEALKLRFADVKLDKVYTSPLMRAKKTALAVIGNRDLAPIEEEGLRELDGGFVEGKPYQYIFDNFEGLADTWHNHPQDFEPEDGEKMRDAYERIWKTVRKLAAENDGKTIACATHGGVTRCLLCRLLKGTIEELGSMPWSENTAVTLLEFDKDLNPKMVFYNDISHLTEDLIPERSKLSNIAVKKP